MKNFWKKFKTGLFTKAQFITGVAIVAVTTSAVVYAYQVLNLNTFSPGQPIRSSEVNENFELINERLAQLGNKFIVSSNFNHAGGSTTLTNIYNSVILDGTEYGYGGAMVSPGSFTVLESGLYEITLTGKTALFYSQSLTLSLLSGSTTIASAWFSGNSTGVDRNIHFLNSGTVLSSKLTTGADDFVLNNNATKLIFEKLD